MEPTEQILCKEERRLRRQISAMASSFPWLERFVNGLLDRRMRAIRIPLGILFILAGLVGFLPVLGFWMLPLGILLLALDLPVLRPPVTAMMIRMRRRIRLWWRKNGSP